MKHIVIVGGGISGLCAAYRLKQDGYRVTLFESSEKIGGKVNAERSKGYLLEHGPNGWLAERKAVGNLVEELGLAHRILRPSETFKKRFLVLDSRGLLPLPLHPLQLIKSPILSANAKIRLLKEPFIKPVNKEETLAEFGERRFGKEATETLFDAFQTGMYAGDIKKLSFSSCFPQIAQMEAKHQSLFRALTQQRKQEKKPDRALLSFPEGMGELIDALGAKLQNSLQTKCRLLTWKRQDQQFQLSIETYGAKSEILADALILTTPGRIQADLISPHDKSLSDLIRSIHYVSLSVVTLGYPRSGVRHPLDGFGFLCPARSGKNLLGTVFSSSLFPNRAPSAHVLLRCLLGGARDPLHATRPDDEVITQSRTELEYLLKVSTKPDLISIIRHDEAIPQYYLGHKSLTDQIEQKAGQIPGLFLGGNLYHGVAVHDCIKDADRLRIAVKDFFDNR